MEKTFFEDFMNFQKEVPKIELNATVNAGKFSFKYADLPGILEVVKPVLRNNNMLVHWRCIENGSVSCHLEHKSGESMVSCVSIKSSDDPKQQGAAITYAKRYSLVALLGIVAEEDKDAPSNQTKNKPKLTSKAFEQAKDRITKGDQNVAKQCLLHFDLTEKQEEELVNLELEYNI